MAFWLGLVIVLLPTDERQQARMVQSATAAITWATTFCDRNAGTCETGARFWATFVKKAEFGFSLATDMIRNWSAGDPAEGPVAPASAPADAAPPPASPRWDGTLKREDTQPAWRGQPKTRA